MRGDFDLYADPYLVAMKRYERYAWRYGAIAGIALIASFFVGLRDAPSTGMLAPIVANVKFHISAGLLIGTCVALLFSTWSMGRRIYFAYWPERFY